MRWIMKSGRKRSGAVVAFLAAAVAFASPRGPAKAEDAVGGSAWLGCAVAHVLLCGISWPSCPRVPGGCFVNLPSWGF